MKKNKLEMKSEKATKRILEAFEEWEDCLQAQDVEILVKGFHNLVSELTWNEAGITMTRRK